MYCDFNQLSDVANVSVGSSVTKIKDRSEEEEAEAGDLLKTSGSWVWWRAKSSLVVNPRST